MSDLPPEVNRVLSEMQAGQWTGSLTIHMVAGEVRGYDQRRSGRVAPERCDQPDNWHLTREAQRG